MVKKSSKVIDGITVPTSTTEIQHFNILEVEVGTTGVCGGDTGHGGRTYFSIKNLASTDLRIKVIGDKTGETEGLEIILGGDAELQTFIEALEFAVSTLKEGS